MQHIVVCHWTANHFYTVLYSI